MKNSFSLALPALLLSALSLGSATLAQAENPNPIAGSRLYVEQGTNAQRQVDSWRRSRPSEAETLNKIASSPQARWFGSWDGDVRRAVQGYVQQASRSGSVPVLVAYNIPDRDCGQYSSGGASSTSAYGRWIRDFAKGIGGAEAIVIVEPDALGQMSCLSASGQQQRAAMLKDAVQTLKSLGRTHVYIDAGNPGWLGASEVARFLQSAGISQADGFALNVSNFFTNTENERYGSEISRLTGDKHFVIDTSRNGRGSAGSSEWCNPRGRALGTAPTTATGKHLVDAYLWIKSPGQSDGTCNGGPSAGTWWAEYALELARNA